MRVRTSAFLAAAAVVLASQSASACHTCRKTPCVLAPAPAPAYQCVTEMVPYTVMKTQRRVDWQPITETVMVREPETTYVDRQRVVCKPVFDTTTVQKRVVVCKPVYDTTTVTENFTVCKPVTTTRQVTEYCMQPSTQLVTVPVRHHKCGSCGRTQPECGCQTVARTCYTPVPVVRDVVQTTMVREVQQRQVPVTTCRIVREEKIVDVPVTTCRIVREVVNEQVPVTTWKCVPKQITRQIPVPVCETVPVTCYRPVTRVVACAAPVAPTAQAAAPSSQTLPSPQ